MAKYVIKDQGAQQKDVECWVDLLNPGQAQVVRSCSLNIQKRRWLYPRLPETQYKLSVECNSPEDWITSDSVIKIAYDGKSERELILDVNSNTVNFQLLFYPCKISDCLQQESGTPEPFQLPYAICLKDLNNNVLLKETGNLTVRFNPIQVSKPVVEFEPNSLGKDLTYSILCTQPFEIGKLVVRHSSNLMRAPSCDFTLTAIAKTGKAGGNSVQVDDLIAFGNDIVQSNPRYKKGGMVPVGKDGTNFTYTLTGANSVKLGTVDVNKRPGETANSNEIAIPILWNMSVLSNPEGDAQEFVLHVGVRGRNIEGGNVSYDDIRIPLKRNTKMMDIEVSFEEGRNRMVLRNGRKTKTRVPDMVQGSYTSYKVNLRNTAEASEEGRENAKIYIKDFRCELPTPGRYAQEQSGVVKPSLFSVDDEHTSIKSQVFDIPIRGNKTFTFCYDHTCISKIMSESGEEIYERMVNIPVEFSYFVDKEDQYSSAEDVPETEFIEFRATIPIKIQKAPSPEWLCLDFGTSAVVASYASNHYDEHGARVDCLIPLRNTKQTLLRQVYKGANKDNLTNILNDTTETDKNLISSDIVVDQGVTRVCETDVKTQLPSVEDYNKAPFKFSPSSGMLDINSRKIPSLKSLMGNRTIPAGLMPANVAINGELTVNRIFEAAYRQLFALFLPEGVRSTNKLVMTIPNTYAPSHVEILRSIAKDSLKQLRGDYIRFMSESDAVAFYYLSRRAELMRGRDLAPDFDSNVLVYDMGAGTLDITYFTRTEKGDKYEISMEGKMGVSRAGNYMDYVLAKVIVALLQPKVEDTVQRPLMELLNLNNYRGRDADSASELKHYARDIVKPMLNKPAETSLPKVRLLGRDMQTEEITVGDILNHDYFKEFLQDVSTNIFKHFKSLFGEINPKLVIFSGRTTCLRVLRKAVWEALSVVFGNNDARMFLDLAGNCFSNDISNDITNISNLKTAVVDGAFSFCSDFAAGKGDYILKNRNVYAQYGLIFRNGDSWIWERLIDVHTRPVNDNPTLSEDGMTIYEYNTDTYDAAMNEDFGNLDRRGRRRDFSTVSQVYVVQSYSSDTLNDWSKNNHDMISVIGYADLSDLGGIREYGITIDSRNRVNFHIGAGLMPLYSHDAYDSESFKMSMWPIVR